MLSSKGYCRCVFFCLVVAGVLTSPDVSRAGMVGILVPAYFYPGTGGPGGVGDGWAQMAADASKVPITAIFNPNSGPGGSTDPNYVNALTNLENAGGHVVAYVFSDNGNASIAAVEGQISTYISQYGSLINGFFIDGMFITPSTLSYYQSLDSYIKGLSSSYTVIGNAGDPFLNGVTPAQYLSTADVVNIFEGPNAVSDPNAPGFNNYPYGLDWFQSYSSNQFSNIIYDAPSSALQADVNKAVQLNAGYVYVTDQNGVNPYAQLPSYWNEEVAAVQAFQSVPEPASLSYLVSAGLCWPMAIAARKRFRQRIRA